MGTSREILSAFTLFAAGAPVRAEVVFERNAPNPNVPKPYYVDGKIRCELP